MDFNLSEEQRLLLDSASRYVRERCDLETRRQAAREAGGFSRRHWQHFADQGWLALTLPEAAGGMGLGMADAIVLMEALGRGLVCEPLIDSSILCGDLIAGAPEQGGLNALLADIGSGTALAALAHVELDGRSEFDTPVTCTAEPDGDGWRLQGTKHRVFYGPSASHLIVSAQVTGEMGYSLFLVEASADGIVLDSFPLIDGTRAADIHFDQVPVSAPARLYNGQAAAKAMDRALNRAIVAASAAALGSMEAVMDMTADYLKTRQQYGKPLSSFQALTHRMADMLVETEQARSMLYAALAALDTVDSTEQNRQVSAAKALIAQAGMWVTGQGIQLHGGIGVTEEYAVGHHYKALQVYHLRFGDSDFHLERCARLIDTGAMPGH